MRLFSLLKIRYLQVPPLWWGPVPPTGWVPLGQAAALMDKTEKISATTMQSVFILYLLIVKFIKVISNQIIVLP
jgi:hypothetical protein